MRIITALFVLLNCYPANAQEIVSHWSEKIRCGENSDYNLLGFDTNFYYLQFQRNNKYFLKKFDRNFVMQKEKGVIKKLSKHERFIASVCINGEIIIFTRRYSEKNTEILANIIDASSMQILRRNVSVMDLIGGRDTAMHYKLLIRDNAVLFCYWGIPPGKFNDRCGYYKFNSNLSLIEHCDFNFPGVALNYYPFNFEFVGNRFYLLTESVEQGYGPLGDSIVSHFRLFYAEEDEKEFRHTDLEYALKSPQESYCIIGDDGLLHVFGFAYSMDRKFALGFYHDQINTLTGKTISHTQKKFITEVRDSTMNLFLHNYYVTNAVINDNGIYVFAEKIGIRQSYSEFNPWYWYLYTSLQIDDGLVIHFNKKNDLEWAQFIPKQQRFSGALETALSFTTVIGNIAVVIFNDNPENRNLKDGEIPNTYFSDKETGIALSLINDDVMKRFELRPDKRNPYQYLIPSKSFNLGGNRIFVITRMGNDFRFGIVQLNG